MRITYDNLYAHVTDPDPVEWDWLRSYLVVPNPIARMVPGQEKTLSLYNGFSNRFPAGLLSRVRSAAKAAGFTVKSTDGRPPPVPADLEGPNDFDWARDYQLEAAVAALTKRRGIIKLPFAAGKGSLVVLIAWSIDQPWIFITHRTQLVLDIADRWQRFTQMQAGLVVQGKWQLPERMEGSPSFICCTFSALHAKWKAEPERVEALLEAQRGLVVDECHVAAASTHSHLLYLTPNCYDRIGLSGTPLDRLDRRNTITEGIFGRVIYEKSTEELVTAKVISKCTVHFVPCSHGATTKVTLAGVRTELITRNAARNKLVVGVCQRVQKPVLVFVAVIKHGERLEAMLNKAGLKTKFVWGSHTVAEREAAAEALRTGELEVVVTNQIWHEGINICELRTIVNAADTKSFIWTLQRAGRGARIVAGEKYDFDLWDIDDRGHRWLEEHSQRRRAAYKRAGYEIIDEAA